MRKLIILTTSILFLINVSAQESSNSYNHLLWRISGKDLKSPSYLFGTMHLTDKRLFNFGDSLYKAIENTEGFAAELDMTRIFSQYINYLIGEQDEPEVYIGEDLSREFVDEYGAKIEKKFKKPLSAITLKDVENMEDRKRSIVLKGGEMSTFMDAYLFDIASRQGKWTGGIEDPEDQFGIKDLADLESRLISILSSGKEDRKTLEWMIKTYLNEDLDLIDRTNEIWRGAKDVILIKRNVKMGRRIDSLANIRSGFFAVGAAHLPGDSGLVNLLRMRGYTLTPVISSKKIKPESYKFKEVPKAWVEVPMLDQYYTVEMPATPEVFNTFQNTIVDMKFHFDIGGMTAYFSMGVPMPSNSTEIKDSVLTRFENTYRDMAETFSSKEIKLGNSIGREILMSNEYGQYRMQVFVPDDYVVVNAVYSITKRSTNSAKAEKFLTSLKPNPNVKTTANKGGWMEHRFSRHAFSVSLPGKYIQKPTTADESGSWTVNAYDAIDLLNGRYYSMMINEAKDGYYGDSDSVFFLAAKLNFEEALEGKIIKEESRNMQGFPSHYFAILSIDEGDSLLSEALLVIRGNIRYMFFKVSEMSSKAPNEEIYFNSIRLLPLEKGDWRHRTGNTGGFSTWSPGEFKQKPLTYENSYNGFMVYDSASAVTTYVEKEKLNEYYWAKDLEALFDEKSKGLVGYADSLVSKNRVKSGDHEGIDLLIDLEGTMMFKKVRLLLNGDTVYSIYSFLPREVLDTKDYKKMFDEFRIHNMANGRDLFKSRSRELLNALAEGDDVEFEEAKANLTEAKFTIEDLPALREATMIMYRDFDTTYYYLNTNSKLVNAIVSLDTVDLRTVDFVRTNYPKLNGDREMLKPFLISMLSGLKHRAAVELMKELLVNDPPNESWFYVNFHAFDSLELTRILYPEVLHTIGHRTLRSIIANSAVSLLEKGMIFGKEISQERTAIHEAANRLFTLDEEEFESESYSYSNFPRLLGAMGDKESKNLLGKMLELNSPDIKFQSLLASVELGLKVDQKHFTTLASSDEWRIWLYDSLKSMGRLNLFPKEFLSREMLGKSVILNYASEDYDPTAIDYLEVLTAEFNGKEQEFLVYVVKYDIEDSNSQFLGVVGPFDLNSEGYEINRSVSGIHWEKNFKKDEIKKLLDAYLEYVSKFLVE